MSEKFMESLASFATQTGLQLDRHTGLVFGQKDGYTLCFQPEASGNQAVLSACVSRSGQTPTMQEMKQAVKAEKVLSSCNIQRYKVNFIIRSALNNETRLEHAAQAITAVTQFFRQNSYANCCQSCGTVGQTKTYLVNALPMLQCEACFAQQSSQADAQQQALSQKKEHIGAGIVGALLGAFIGVIAIVLLNMLGYVAAISGFIMGICTLKGYELLGGKLTTKGIVIGCILMLVMVYFGNQVSWCIEIANYFDVDYFTAFLAVPELLSEGAIETSVYFRELGLLYFFTVLGAIPSILSVVKAKKNANITYEIHSDLK